MSPVQSRCGWAFSSVGRPCVAQRVWPMPKEPSTGSSCMASSRLRSLPEARRMASSRHRRNRRRGRPNRSRDIRERFRPSRMMGTAFGVRRTDDSTHELIIRGERRGFGRLADALVKLARFLGLLFDDLSMRPGDVIRGVVREANQGDTPHRAAGRSEMTPCPLSSGIIVWVAEPGPAGGCAPAARFIAAI